MMVEILSQIFIFDHEKLLDEDTVTKKNKFCQNVSICYLSKTKKLGAVARVSDITNRLHEI